MFTFITYKFLEFKNKGDKVLIVFATILIDVVVTAAVLQEFGIIQ